MGIFQANNDAPRADPRSVTHGCPRGLKRI